MCEFQLWNMNVHIIFLMLMILWRHVKHLSSMHVMRLPHIETI